MFKQASYAYSQATIATLSGDSRQFTLLAKYLRQTCLIDLQTNVYHHAKRGEIVDLLLNRVTIGVASKIRIGFKQYLILLLNSKGLLQVFDAKTFKKKMQQFSWTNCVVFDVTNAKHIKIRNIVRRGFQDTYEGEDSEQQNSDDDHISPWF